MIPDRIAKLIERIEAGETVTQADVDWIAVLQALDLAKAGEDFVREVISSGQEQIEGYKYG